MEKTLAFGIMQTWNECQLWHSLALWPWAGQWTCLNMSLAKLEIIPILSFVEGLEMVYLKHFKDACQILPVQGSISSYTWMALTYSAATSPSLIWGCGRAAQWTQAEASESGWLEMQALLNDVRCRVLWLKEKQLINKVVFKGTSGKSQYRNEKKVKK